MKIAADRRRVVITGLGLVTPLGLNVAASWDGAVAGTSTVGPITQFDVGAMPSRIAAEVAGFDPSNYLDSKETRKTDRFIQFAIAAADEAINDAKLQITPQNTQRIGIAIGSAIGGLLAIEAAAARYAKDKTRKVSPYLIPMMLGNMAAGHVSIRHGIRGVNLSHSTACSAGTHAIGEAMLHIRRGAAEVILAGGSEAAITPLSVGSFGSMRALSQRNDEPQRASRPFDLHRDGFVIGEGAGVLVLEDLDHARRRGAAIYAELLGYGASADAYHLTQPDPEALGSASAMALALEDARLEPAAISYINAHGTSTLYNDHNETLAIKQVFGAHAHALAVSSTKSMIGHSLGAAGAIEAAVTVLALTHQIIPPTINYETPDPECDLDYTPNQARHARLDAAVSNSYGFGGTNGSLVFGVYHDA